MHSTPTDSARAAGPQCPVVIPFSGVEGFRQDVLDGLTFDEIRGNTCERRQEVNFDVLRDEGPVFEHLIGQVVQVGPAPLKAIGIHLFSEVLTGTTGLGDLDTEKGGDTCVNVVTAPDLQVVLHLQFGQLKVLAQNGTHLDDL